MLITREPGLGVDEPLEQAAGVQVDHFFERCGKKTNRTFTRPKWNARQGEVMPGGRRIVVPRTDREEKSLA
jgi:hypothetical protein